RRSASTPPCRTSASRGSAASGAGSSRPRACRSRSSTTRRPSPAPCAGGTPRASRRGRRSSSSCLLQSCLGSSSFKLPFKCCGSSCLKRRCDLVSAPRPASARRRTSPACRSERSRARSRCSTLPSRRPGRRPPARVSCRPSGGRSPSPGTPRASARRGRSTRRGSGGCSCLVLVRPSSCVVLDSALQRGVLHEPLQAPPLLEDGLHGALQAPVHVLGGHPRPERLAHPRVALDLHLDRGLGGGLGGLPAVLLVEVLVHVVLLVERVVLQLLGLVAERDPPAQQPGEPAELGVQVASYPGVALRVHRDGFLGERVDRRDRPDLAPLLEALPRLHPLAPLLRLAAQPVVPDASLDRELEIHELPVRLLHQSDLLGEALLRRAPGTLGHDLVVDREQRGDAERAQHLALPDQVERHLHDVGLAPLGGRVRAHALAVLDHLLALV